MNSSVSFKLTETKQLARQGIKQIFTRKPTQQPLPCLLFPSFFYAVYTVIVLFIYGRVIGSSMYCVQCVHYTVHNIKYESWGWSTDPPCSWARKQFLGSYGWEKQSGKEKSTNIMVFSLITNYAFLAAQLIVSFFSTTVFVTQLCFKILFLHSKPSWLSGSLHCNNKIYLRIKTEPVTVGATVGATVYFRLLITNILSKNQTYAVASASIV